jgi:hypothetical protein
MPSDPTYPLANASIESGPLRDQFQALFDLIQSIAAVTSAH